jgi:regulator of nonsense transcripts 1
MEDSFSGSQRYVPGTSTFANHAMSWQQPGASQNLYSSQSSIGLALSQSDRLRMMSEMASQNNSNLMSQDSVSFNYDDYKSQDVNSLMSQDFDIRSQASQSFTQF